MTSSTHRALTLAREALLHLRRCMCPALPTDHRCIRCRALAALDAELSAAPTHREVEWRDHAAP